MSWVRAGAICAALSVHAAAAGALMSLGAKDGGTDSAAGRDDLTVVATVTLQTEESIGPDAITAERQDASAASKPEPETKLQEAKREEAIEMDPPPPEAEAPPQAPIQAKAVEKPEEMPKATPSAPSLPAAAQEEQHAMSRELEARRSRLFSLYNAEIQRAIALHRLLPKRIAEGRVVVELTLSPGGKLLDHRVVKSSGVPVLDQTAMANLERAPFPPAPDGLLKKPYTVTFPIDYSFE